MAKNKKSTSQVQSSKPSNGHDQIKNKKKELSRLIKVLRPKVYIIDSSSFKRLVQELTGNGSSTATAPAKPQETRRFENVPEACLESSTTDSSDQFLVKERFDQEYDQVCHRVGLEDINMKSSLANELDDHQMEFLAYWDIESLLEDTANPYTFSTGFDQLYQDISVYDYELSGLL